MQISKGSNDGKARSPHSARSKQGDYSQLITPAHRLLRFTLKSTWKMMKGLTVLAFRLPRLFAKMNETDNKQRKNP
jgi:hypothetical protein